MSKYIVIRTDQDGEAKTCVLAKGGPHDSKITGSHYIAHATRDYLAGIFSDCQYDIIELYNWEPL